MLSPPSVLCAGREFHWWGWPPCSRCHHWIVQRTWIKRWISSQLILFQACHSPVLSGGMQSIGSCQVLYHGLDHQLEEEPGAVGDVLPRVVPRQGELQGQLLVDQLPKTCASKCCKCSKISAWYNFSFFWHFIFRLHPIRVHIAIPTMAIMWYHVPFPIQIQGFHHLFISEIYRLLPYYHFTIITEFKTPVDILSIALYVLVNLR